MINIFMSENGKLTKREKIEPGVWVQLCAPDETEIKLVNKELGINIDLLRAALDEEERSRIDTEDNSTLILVDTPTVEVQGRSFVYSTIPFGIILCEQCIVTVCVKETALSRAFSDSSVKFFSTKKHNKATLQMLYRNAALFLFYLREVDKASARIENELHVSMRNDELIQMLGLEKSLVYFSTSLKGNEMVMEKLMRLDFVKDYREDAELLEDVIVENKQAIEMCNIYRDILSGTRDAFASVISNNLSTVMKVLAMITIVLTIPTIVFSLWGTNVPVPFAHSPFGFIIVIAISALFTGIAFLIMKIKKWL